MKRYAITFLIFSAFAGAFAQNYSQTFDGGFQHVDLNHTSTGLFYEPGILSECTHQQSSLVKQTHSSDTDKADSVNNHSIGINVGWLNGVSLKFHLKNNVYLQTDLGLFYSANPLYFIHDVFGPFLYLGYGGQVCILYESNFPMKPNVSWITGIGMSFFKSIDSYPDSPAFKSGISAVLGIEWKFKIPLSIRLDTRQGYGVLFAPVRNPKTKSVSSVDCPWHFFDYAFVLSFYYHFSKKNN